MSLFFFLSNQEWEWDSSRAEEPQWVRQPGAIQLSLPAHLARQGHNPQEGAGHERQRGPRQQQLRAQKNTGSVYIFLFQLFFEMVFKV